MPTANHQPNWRVRCMSVPGEDTDLGTYVSFDNARFLFGCGEGTQRAFAQKRIGLKGLSAVFLGSGDNQCRAGLAGMIMTAADAGVKRLDVIGPPDTAHYIATLRSSCQRDQLNIEPFSFPPDVVPGEAKQVFHTPNITVRAIALRPSPTSSVEATSSAIPPSATFDNGLPFDPTPPFFRPSSLSPALLPYWINSVVGDMFGKRLQYTPPSPGSTTRCSPLLNLDGTLRAARADTRFAIPRASPENVDTEMVYICQAPDLRGKFDVAKAKALGVPNGPVRGRLTRGETIEVDDVSVEGGKRLVRPEDCLVGGGPGAVLIMINCSEQNLPSLLSATYLHQYQPGRNEGALQVHVIIHRVPRSVWQREEYQAWLRLFGANTNHFLADSEQHSRDTFFRSAAWNTLQLSLLNTEIFPPPTSAPPSPLPPSSTTSQLLLPNHEISMHPLGPPHIIPHHMKDRPFPSSQADLAWARDVLATEIPEYAQACSRAKASVEADPRYQTPGSSQPGDDIVVTTLGTGSAIPSKYRNVSATHLSIPNTGGILLDCGEGSLGQLRRRFGPDGLRQLYSELKMIFISHMHADHHLGLQAILQDRLRHGFSEPLFVVGPLNIAMAMQEAASWQHGFSQAALDAITFVDNSQFNRADSPPPSPSRDRSRRTSSVGSQSGWPAFDVLTYGPESSKRHHANVQRLITQLKLKSIQVPLVEHRGRAYGLALEHESGWKVVYSGDTKPCDALVEAGKGATLLIHEATLEDDKPDVAAAKGHSTFAQAIDIGRRMEASHVLLNHFSQRYPKLPKLAPPTQPHDGDSQAAEPIVSISFDFMSIRVRDMWKMSHYMEALTLLFEEVEAEEGDDTIEAVEHDINPTVDGANEGDGMNGDGVTGDKKVKTGKEKASGTVSKKAQRRAEQKASKEKENAELQLRQKLARAVVEEEARANDPSKRECSPSAAVPEGKKRKSGG